MDLGKFPDFSGEKHHFRCSSSDFPAGARGGRVDPSLTRRVGARATVKKFQKNTTTLVRSCRSLWYIHMPNLSNV